MDGRSSSLSNLTHGGNLKRLFRNILHIQLRCDYAVYVCMYVGYTCRSLYLIPIASPYAAAAVAHTACYAHRTPFFLTLLSLPSVRPRSSRAPGHHVVAVPMRARARKREMERERREAFSIIGRRWVLRMEMHSKARNRFKCFCT